MPPLRVDWQSIKGAVADVTAPYVFLLPNGGRHLLLAVADMLQWEATYRAYGYDYTDWDDLQAVQSDAVAGLLGGVPLDELLTRLDAIIGLLENADYCCQLQPYDEEVTSDFSNSVPGTDTPPGTWGDGEVVADTDDWQQLVCGAAHAYVDHLVSMANQIDTLISIGALTIGAVAAILSLLAGAGILLAVSYGTAAGVVAGLAELAGGAIFSDAAGDIEAARSDIVCGVIEGGLSSKVQAAVSATAWSTFFQFVDYGSARNVMLEGGHGEEYLDVNRRSDCACDIEFDYTQDPDWETGAHGWTNDSGGGGWAPNNVTCPGVWTVGTAADRLLASPRSIASDVGQSWDSNTEFYLIRIEAVVECGNGQFRFQVRRASDGTLIESDVMQGPGSYTWDVPNGDTERVRNDSDGLRIPWISGESSRFSQIRTYWIKVQP